MKAVIRSLVGESLNESDQLPVSKFSYNRKLAESRILLMEHKYPPPLLFFVFNLILG